MGRIPEETIEKIIQHSDIIDIVSEFVPLKRSGRNYMGVCPFHGDKGPSLSVSREKQLYHCFGCAASGNVVGFVMRIRNLEFIDAIKYLAEKANIPIEEEAESPEKRKEQSLREKLYEINITAARFYYSNLARNDRALGYFKKRDLSERTIKKFGLGFSLDSWNSLYSFLLKKGYKEELILKAGLIIKGNNNYYDRFRNRIIFPVFDIKGHVVAFGGRVLDDSKPKYLNSPETPVFVKGTNLYGLNYVVKSGLPDSIIVVEGYMDCISLHQSGITNAVASLGTALTLEQAKLLRRYSKDIYICYDADAAGKAATLRGLDILSSVDCNVKIISIPRGKDPDEYLKTYGQEGFRGLINEAVPILDYRIKRAQEGKDLKNPRQKSQFINEVAVTLSSAIDEVEIQAYASKVFDETGIDVKVILDQISRLKNQNENKRNSNENIRNNNVSGNVFNIEPAYKKAELWLLRLSMADKKYFEFINKRINPEEFITDIYRDTAKFIFEALANDKEINSSELIIKYTDEHDIRDISRIFQEEAIEVDEKLISDYIKTIKKFNIEHMISQITIEIKKHEGSSEIQKSAELFTRLIGLQKKLSQL